MDSHGIAFCVVNSPKKVLYHIYICILHNNNTHVFDKINEHDFRLRNFERERNESF